MKTQVTSGTTRPAANADDSITRYVLAQTPAFRAICDHFCTLIDTVIPKATAKVWHGSPVWFLDDNPVVGFKATAKSVNLLFWNGQAFDEPALESVGKHRAAQAKFGDVGEMDATVIRRWLTKAKSDVLDSKAYIKSLRPQ
jgi:hypothetical protein